MGASGTTLFTLGWRQMCGIAGCVLFGSASPGRERLEAMRAALSHRGPDGWGIEVLDNVGLVHTRLAIVDTSEHARQPMHHPSRPMFVTFNGEIYNHKALREELRGETFISDGDTDTLLHAFANWGPAVLDRLNGQFAFACLDLEAGKLTLARDRFGIKPLYVLEAEDGIWFASEPQALFASGVKASPRPSSWFTVVDSSCYRGELTLLQGVRRLLPGTMAEIPLRSPALRVRRWCSVAAHVTSEDQEHWRASPRAALVAELENRLRSSVHDALLADVPVGTMCSGGVDSSLITALASEFKKDLVAFAASYKGGPGPDEGPAAKRVARALGIEVDVLEVTKPSWRAGFVGATLHFGAPLHNASSVAVAQIAARARTRGIKVLLTGEGADELFAGYSNHRQAPLADFLSLPQRTVRELEWALSQPSSHLLGRVLKHARMFAGRRPRSGRSRFALAVPKGRAAGGDEPGAEDAAEAYGGHIGPRGELEGQLVWEFDRSLGHLLNRMDKNMMQASVEARVPFLDPRVVRFALNLPLEARVLPWSKGILRDVARRLLPLATAHRVKIHGMIFDAGDWVEDAADPSFLSQGMFRQVFKVSDAEFSVLLGHTNSAERLRLWSAEVWCRSVFGGQAAAAIEKELWPHGP